jgi:hypothetical protein
MRYFCNFQTTAQSKQSPIGRKFAQSGHPVRVKKHSLSLAQKVSWPMLKIVPHEISLFTALPF